MSVDKVDQIYQSWAEDSKKVLQQIHGELNLPYGNESFQKIDYFSAGTNTPLVIYVHGGYWQARSKNDFTFIVPTFLAAGISIALVGYRLAPSANMTQMVEDIHSSIDCLHTQFPAHQTIWLLGWSAGAHLITMALDNPNVAGGTAVSGIYDLEPIRHIYVNELLGLDEKSAFDHSPLKLGFGQAKPLDLFVGGNELPEMLWQTDAYYSYRKSKHQPGSYSILPNTNHYSIFNPIIEAEGKIIQSIQDRLLRSKSTEFK
ncbi:MAG: alpha/beta hydrolase [Polynucleobacter sp.]|nr:alpha/beta hydrolase [Polynucleobacter sp.]